MPGRSAKLKQLGQNMESAAIIIIIIIINYFYHHRHHHHEKMKQRANFCVITQFLAHHFGLSCGKKSPLHAVVWCWSFWMVVRLNNSYRPLQQPAFAATISIVVPIYGMRVTNKCMMACNGEMRTVQQHSWYWNSEMHGHVTRYCFHLTGFCCFIFLNKLATIENTTAIYLQRTRFSGLFQQLAMCSTTWFRWYNAMITSRAEPANVQETTLCVFFLCNPVVSRHQCLPWCCMSIFKV